MLRKVRREGLTGEQLAALGGSSRIDDSEAAHRRPAGAPGRRRQGQDRRDRAADGRRRLCQHAAPRARVLQRADPACAARHARAGARRSRRSRRSHGGQVEDFVRRPAPVAAPRGAAARRRRSARLGRADPASSCRRPSDFGKAFAVAGSTESPHDPELDEAVIAFANADFEQCEQALPRSPAPAARARSTPRPGWCCSTCTAPPASSTSSRAWRSTTPSSSAGRRRSGSRCPSWSPRRPARSGRRSARVEGQVGWVCPELPRRRRRRQAALARAADAAALGVRLERAARPSTPRPAAGSRSCSAAGSRRTSTCAGSSGERLFTVLQEAAPTGVRDADPAFWQLRLDALRMANRPDQFDEAAIDYCVTYEVSPPSWEPARCKVRISGSNQGTTAAAAVGGERRLDQLPGIADRRRARPGRGRHGRALGPAGRRHRRRR